MAYTIFSSAHASWFVLAAVGILQVVDGTMFAAGLLFRSSMTCVDMCAGRAAIPLSGHLFLLLRTQRRSIESDLA